MQDSRQSRDALAKSNESQRAELEFVGRARLDAETELLTTTKENLKLQVRTVIIDCIESLLKNYNIVLTEEYMFS